MYKRFLRVARCGERLVPRCQARQPKAPVSKGETAENGHKAFEAIPESV